MSRGNGIHTYHHYKLIMIKTLSSFSCLTLSSNDLLLRAFVSCLLPSDVHRYSSIVEETGDGTLVVDLARQLVDLLLRGVRCAHQGIHLHTLESCRHPRHAHGPTQIWISTNAFVTPFIIIITKQTQHNTKIPMSPHKDHVVVS